MTDMIKVYTQSSIRIDGSMGKIYLDPFRMRDKPHNADYILITHDHYDHFSPDDIRKVAGDDTIIVVPGTMMGKAREVADAVADIRMVKAGESGNIDGLIYETIPAYNINKTFHTKREGWVGYILTIDDKRIYIAGDTDATDEAKAVKCDIAMVPIGGTYTMDAGEAANLINIISPMIAIPIHYGSIVGSDSDADVFKRLVKDPIKVEIKM